MTTRKTHPTSIDIRCDAFISETYCKICKKHNLKPTQVIADGNIAQILNNDQGKHLEYHETLLDEYLKVYYHKGRPAQ